MKLKRKTTEPRPKLRRLRRTTVLRSLLEATIADTARSWGVSPAQLSDACNSKEIDQPARARIESATGIDYTILRLPAADVIGVFFEAARDAGVFG